ncbi:MAG: hypothetical protein AAF945_20635, partial [Actinomycetota bacterium]
MARHLREDLSSVCVFRDEDDLIGGQDWRRALETAMASADAAIVLAGSDWAGGARPGERRIDDVEDPVREEVRQALSPSTRVRAIPVLLDGASPAPNVPDDIAELFDAPHRVDSSRLDLESGGGEGYQRVLVSIWEALRARVPNGLLVIGSEQNETALDQFVQQLKDRGAVDEARSLSRRYAGAYILSRRESKKVLKSVPDAIVLVDADAGAEHLLRVAAYVGLRTTREVRLVGSGAAAAFA